MNTLNPALGSNQFITKFDEKSKRKFKLRIKTATKIKIAIGIILLASLAGNYYMLKQFMVLRCSEGGYVMSKEHCNELAQNHFDSQELNRLQRVQDNPDLFNQ